MYDECLPTNWGTVRLNDVALRDMNKPIGIVEFLHTISLPEELQDSLPTVAQIEAELAGQKPSDEEE